MRSARPAAAAALLLLLLAAGCRREPPRLDLPAVVRGHQEVVVGADGSLTPLVLGVAWKPGLCLEVPAATDTSRWEAALSFGGWPSPTGFAPPAARLGQTVCFDASLPEGLPPEANLELCGRLIDRFDGAELRLPCRPVRFQADDGAYKNLTAAFDAAVARAGGGLDPLLAALDELAVRARGAGLPLLAVRADLIAAHYLSVEGKPTALREARSRLDRLPPWLGKEEASRRGAQLAHQRAQLVLAEGGPPGSAWRELAEAERRYQRIASHDHFTVTMLQSDLLAQVGAAREAIERLRAALAECGRMKCDPEFLNYGRLQLSWLLLLDPDATPEVLYEAERTLAAGLAALPQDGDLVERANQLVNSAYLAVRLLRDPALPLRRAREALAAAEAGGERRSLLLAWADLVEGLSALDRGDGGRARELCEALARRADPRLASWAASCAARARRLQGDLAGADQAFSEAMRRHEHADAREMGLWIPLGPGQRAADFAQAARVAVERGEPGRAWDLLVRLDTLSAHEGERRECRERAADPAAAARWQEIDATSQRLLADLAALDFPASGTRRDNAEPVRRELQERLRALWREWPGCHGIAAGGDEGVRFRAVALEDEILLLGRDAAGRVALERRTPMPRQRLARTLERIGQALAEGGLDDGAWRQLTRPLAEALLPRDPAALAAVTPFALHGSLQEVPLAALPLPGEAGRWLADVTAVALQPAAARARVTEGEASPPLFVVDPLGDLPGGSRSLALYRELFPAARVLHGEAATRAAVGREAAGALWLHLDSHGAYEPAFPELSSLLLADGRLSFVELAALPMPRRFANLSGCRTGVWPATADSGRYGLGGLLARLGVEWVIASRTDLADDLAHDYNRAFYQAVSQGISVPGSHRKALAAVRERRPAAEWAGILLLRAAAAAPREK